MAHAVRQAMHLIGRENRARWFMLIVLALVASGFEIVGAALVYLLLALVANPEGEIDLPLLGDIRTRVDISDDTLLLTLAASMGVFFVVRAVVHIGQAYAQNRVGYSAGAKLSTKLVRGYLTMPYMFHLTRNSSELIRNGYQAVDEMVGHVFLPMIRVAAEIVMVISMLVLLVVIAPAATGLAIVVIGGAALVLLIFVQPRLKRLGRTAHRARRETLGLFQQSLHGIRDIKVLGLERSFAAIYGKGRRELARAIYLRATATELPRTVIETALIGFILLFFALAITTGEGASETLSVLGLFGYAGLRLQPSLHRILSGLNNLKFSAAPLADLDADLRLIDSDSEDGRQPDPLPFEHSLRLEGVQFKYESADRMSLEGLDLSVHPGEVIGICGPTGGGKTTLIDVMTGLLPPTAGRVTVDGKDLQHHTRAWHRNLGIVPQMVFLTDDSLRRNIALGVPDKEIDETAVLEAVHLAQLSEFIESLPEGLDTVVGERGVRVSGGQRQRVAIARALYRRPPVIVFDEGTSALDNATEAELMSALERLRGRHTILMVAHRLSTVRSCDRIIYLEAGRVAGLGTYEDLSANNAAFRRMSSR